MKILIIEDEKIKRITLTDALLKKGYYVSSFDNPVEGLDAFEDGDYDVLVTDLRLPKMNGLDLVEKVKNLKPATEVIVMTAYATVDTAVRAMKLGAYDYITKPFSSEELIFILERLDNFKNVIKENIKLKQEITHRYSFNNIIGKSKEMQAIYDLIKTIAPRDTTILIVGESGTGKELIAHAVHYNSPRKDKPLIKLSCAALTESLLESELFGHEKGAFTGAVKEKKGRFELANEGTIFLDDVDDIPLSMQPKLLRVLQEREFERVGGTKTIRVDIRVICATKKDLLLKVRDSEFREDLFYRLNVVPIKLPPLRERKEDIPLLCEHFIKKYCGTDEKKTITNEAMKLLMNYDWKGNVRELENVIERVITISNKHEVTTHDLPEIIMPSCQKICDQYLADVIGGDVSFDNLVSEVEKKLLFFAIERAHGNKSEAARLLKMKRETFRDKIEKYGLNE